MSPGYRRATSSISRRTFRAATGISVVAFACGDDTDAAPPATSSSTTPPGDTEPDTDSDVTDAADAPPSADPVAFAPEDFEALGACVLFPRAAAGPFPTLEQLYRRDVTEGYPGHAMRVGLRVIDQDCRPVSGATVEIWHTDATGDYSSYEDGGNGKDEGQGTTFMRGAQVADDNGIVEFQTIYPGWYPGRAVHIHLRVRVDDALVLTGQVYFDDAYTAEVFTEDAYAANGEPDTLLAADFGADDAANGALLALTPDGGGTTALVNVSIPV